MSLEDMISGTLLSFLAGCALEGIARRQATREWMLKSDREDREAWQRVKDAGFDVPRGAIEGWSLNREPPWECRRMKRNDRIASEFLESVGYAPTSQSE